METQKDFLFDYDKTKKFLLLVFTLSIITSMFVSVYLKNTNKNDIIHANHETIGSIEWQDSLFRDYEMRAEIYLDKFEDIPITAGMLRLAAWNAYDSTGVIVPLELALAQAQMESSMGTKGRSPVNNPYNVGEYDNGAVLWYYSTFEGVQAYYYLISRNYLKYKSLETLLKSFTNMNGHRYASSPNYEESLKQQISYIEQYINNRLN